MTKRKATAKAAPRRSQASRTDAERDCRTVDHFLKLGFPAVAPPGENRQRTATRMASDLLGADRALFGKRVGTPDCPGSHFRLHALRPDWGIAAARGELPTAPVMPGFAIREVTSRRDGDGALTGETIRQTRALQPAAAIPEGHVVKGVSRYLDGQGNLIGEWVKTRAGTDPLDVVEAIKAAFAEYPGRAAPVPAPEAVAADLLTVLPLADWHVGLHAWGKETGVDWDLKIAEGVLGGAVEAALARSPASGLAVVLGGGDLMHADNQENRTARSGHQLDVDGRYPKVFGVASRLMVRTVDAALARHARVVVRVLKGNHDEHCAVAIAHFLLAWYRDEPRVTVDVDPSLFWWFRFGSVMLGATHGHTVKIQDMAQIMAHRRAADWGLTRHRYVLGFHLHHTAKFATEGAGVISEVFQAPVPQDAWHYGSGFLSGRSIQAITYHARHGEISRARVAILDDAEAAA